MNASYALPAAVGAGAIIAAGAGVWFLLRRRQTPEQIECARRLRVHAIGRITSGEILDMIPAPPEAGEEQPPTLVYEYEVGGVTYEVSQQLYLIPRRLDPQSWIPGLPVQVMFEPAHPGNSIVACEHWLGLGARRRAGA
ncbi:MAG: hypothetical protein ACRD0Y_07735 [Terriglobales bacterium]